MFVGDLIDRGPAQMATLRLVRAMTDAGSAQVVMGNHEFNAIAYATVDPARHDYCRRHGSHNDAQHHAFLAEVGFDTPLHHELIEWLMTIPLWLELDGLRVIHACWSPRHIDVLRRCLGPGNTLTRETVIDGTTEGHATFEAIEVLIKGPEIELDGAWYRDKEGHPRYAARLRWWDATADTLRAAALIPPGTNMFGPDGAPVPAPTDRPLRADEVAPYVGPCPVLFGHYWWKRGSSEPMNPLAGCLDFSVAKGGELAAYRWDGEAELDPSRLVFC